MYINFLGVKGFFCINIFNSFIFLTLMLSFYNEFNLYQTTIFLNLGNFFKLSYNSITHISFFIDYISYNFSLLTCLISFFVYFYTYSYMRFELFINQFFFYLKGFVLSMILLL